MTAETYRRVRWDDERQDFVPVDGEPPLPNPSVPQIGRFHRDGPETERLAAARVAPRTGSQREKVLAALRAAGERGMTDYELWSTGEIGARPHVPGTRREELIAAGWPIIDSGDRRTTDTGSPAIVWVLRTEE